MAICYICQGVVHSPDDSSFMDKFANYISRIEIQSLWSNRKHIVWNLNPRVNILSGVNGVGKSTILNRIIAYLRHKNRSLKSDTMPGVLMEFEPREATQIRFNVIKSLDTQLMTASILSKIGDEGVRSELDWRLYELQRQYLDYQVNIGNRIISILTSGREGANEEAKKASGMKTCFQDMIDELFADTNKKIDRSCNELRFIQYGESLSPYVLSAGEKQILLILLTVLLEDCRPYVLFMDEPEVSLHVEWQQKLVSLVLALNENVQIILTTHSPAMVMNGWTDAVTEVSDITVDKG